MLDDGRLHCQWSLGTMHLAQMKVAQTGGFEQHGFRSVAIYYLVIQSAGIAQVLALGSTAPERGVCCLHSSAQIQMVIQVGCIVERIVVVSVSEKKKLWLVFPANMPVYLAIDADELSAGCGGSKVLPVQGAAVAAVGC